MIASVDLRGSMVIAGPMPIPADPPVIGGGEPIGPEPLPPAIRVIRA